METATVPRLLNVLQTNINNLPAFFLQRGITNQAEIDELIETFRKQIVSVAKLNVEHEQIKQRQLRALQLEIDFVKKMYLSKEKKLQESEHYRKLYNDTLKTLENLQKNHEYERRLNNEQSIEQIVRSASSSDGRNNDETIQTLEGNFKTLLRIVYPNDNDENISNIHKKLISYLNSSLAANKIIENLNTTVDALNKELKKASNDQINQVINRCNEKINHVKKIVSSYSDTDSNKHFELLTDLVTELRYNMNGRGFWDYDVNFAPINENGDNSLSYSVNESNTLQHDEYFEDSLTYVGAIQQDQPPQLEETNQLTVNETNQPTIQQSTEQLPPENELIIQDEQIANNEADLLIEYDTESSEIPPTPGRFSDSTQTLTCSINERPQSNDNSNNDISIIDLENENDAESTAQILTPNTQNDLNNVIMDDDADIFVNGVPKTPGRSLIDYDENILNLDSPQSNILKTVDNLAQSEVKPSNEQPTTSTQIQNKANTIEPTPNMTKQKSRLPLKRLVKRPNTSMESNSNANQNKNSPIARKNKKL